MSKFNSSVSVVGIQEVKVQQAILKLLENCNALNEQIKVERRHRTEEVRLLKQKISALGGEA